MKSKDDNPKTRDRQGGNRYFIDNAFLKTWGAKLGPHCIAVYNVLVMHANADSQTAFPSFQTIADMTGMSRRQAIREIKKLEEKNIISVQEDSTPAADPTKKIYSSNVFTLLHPDEWVKIEDQSLYEPGDTQSPGVGTDSHQPGDTQSPPLVTGSHPNKTHPNKTQLTTPNGVAGKPPPGAKTILRDKFLELTGLTMPTSKQDISFWWGNFGEILRLARGDPDLACRWESETVGYMQASHLTITSPKSIVGLIGALASGQTLQKASKNGYHGPSQNLPRPDAAGETGGLSETSKALAAAWESKRRGSRRPP